MASKRAVKAGNAFIQFSLRDGKVKKQLRALQKRLLAIGSGLQKLGSIGLKVGIGMAAGLAYPIKAASDLQETMGKFNTVFGTNAEDVKKWGDTFAGEVGRSKTQVAGFLASMQDLFVPMGFASQEAEGLSKQVTRLAIDLASFNNKTDAEVIRDLQAALTGSGETMKKYGVIVSQAAVNQELLNQGMDPKTATEMQKMQARLNIIMAGTTAAQGDATRTAGSFANMLKRAQGVSVDFAAAIGGPLLGPLSNLLEMFSNVATAAGEKMGGAMASVVDAAIGLGDVFIQLWEVTKTVWTTTQQLVNQAVSSITFAMLNWQTIGSLAANTVLHAVTRFANQMAYFFTEVMPGMLQWFYNNWRDYFTDVANMTATIATNIWKNLSNLWDAIVGLFSGEGFSFEWVGLTEGFESAIRELPKIAEREIGPLEDALKKEMDRLGGELNRTWEDHSREFEASIDSFTPKLEGITTDSQRATAASAQAVASAVGKEVAKVSSRGTFSVAALAAGALRGGGDDYAKRTAKAAEETAKNTNKIAKCGVMGA